MGTTISTIIKHLRCFFIERSQNYLTVPCDLLRNNFCNRLPVSHRMDKMIPLKIRNFVCLLAIGVNLALKLKQGEAENAEFHGVKINNNSKYLFSVQLHFLRCSL
jgi:hypothetical protein